MYLLELFPTIVGVFECDTFDRDGPGWRASVAEAMAERESKLGTPQHQTDDRLHERAELAGMIAFFQRCAADYMGVLSYRLNAGTAVAVLLGQHAGAGRPLRDAPACQQLPQRRLLPRGERGRETHPVQGSTPAGPDSGHPG